MLKMPTRTTTEILTETQQSTNTHLFPNLDPPATSTGPTFTELLEEYNASLRTPEITWDHLTAALETEDINEANSPATTPSPHASRHATM